MYIEERGKSLLLRWRHEGKPYSFSMRGHNNPIGWSQAKSKLAEIETDIIAGYFDTTLLKYRLRKTGKKPTAISAVEVFQKYAEDRLLDRGLTHSSRERFKGIASKLGQFLGDKRRGHLDKKGTKTEKFRTVDILPSVQSMLRERYERVKPQPDDLVFPRPKGQG
jgi:hypothetical protein